MHRMLRIEWDAVAGVLAAVTAIVLHFLHSFILADIDRGLVELDREHRLSG